ncbi:MAG TPA: LysM domain-containing protein [Anaeromyxobacteraceae bacterium]|nr:LysM domain-containing protein [Anaeromyxobacteraceae bacterium]
MTRTTILALLALFPAAALAQTQALDAARGAQKTTDATNARITGAADQAAAGGAQPAGPAGQPAPAKGPAEESPLPAEAAPPVAEEARAAVAPPDTYTIRPGDTLWDLSGRFLNNPWYWPKIWSYNPEITNPHWIYPGNVLKFFPSAEEGPARVEPMVAGAPAEPGAELVSAEAQGAEEEGEAPRELEDFSRADMKSPEAVDEDVVAVAGPYKVGYMAPRTLLARHDSFVTQRELDESGAISAAFDEKEMLTTTDKAYARFKVPSDVKKGEIYIIYKTERPISNPVNHETIGYQTLVLGAARVVEVADRSASLVIAAAFEPIERGAMLGPWTEKVFRPVKARPNGRSLDGLIVATRNEAITEIGEHHVVFVDRGKADGVEEGNTFKVVRAGDPYGRSSIGPIFVAGMPKEDVGELLVIDARERASAALVVRSLRELAVGDRVEMRASAGSGSN